MNQGLIDQMPWPFFLSASLLLLVLLVVVEGVLKRWLVDEQEKKGGASRFPPLFIYYVLTFPKMKRSLNPLFLPCTFMSSFVLCSSLLRHE